MDWETDIIILKEKNDLILKMKQCYLWSLCSWLWKLNAWLSFLSFMARIRSSGCESYYLTRLQFVASQQYASAVCVRYLCAEVCVWKKSSSDWHWSEAPLFSSCGGETPDSTGSTEGFDDTHNLGKSNLHLIDGKDNQLYTSALWFRPSPSVALTIVAWRA